jgi:hypothetical protein
MQLDLYRAIDVEDLTNAVSLQDPENPVDLIKGRRRVNALVPGVDNVRSSTLQVRRWEAKRLNLDDGETYFLVVTHRAQTWSRNTEYDTQRYALAVTIEDEAREGVDLYALVTQRIELPARIRV